MVRPKSVELTARELAVMQVFWSQQEATAEEARQQLADSGEDLAYATVANVVRGLADRKFLRQLNQQRPFRYRAIRRFEDVSRRLVGDMISRLFGGSREALLVQLLDRGRLTQEEREYLQDVLRQQGEDT